MTRSRNLFKLTLSFPFVFGSFAVMAYWPQAAAAQAASEGSIGGVVTNSKTGEKIKNATVTIQCTCLQAERRAQTNENGVYRFDNLPAGLYGVTVYAGESTTTKNIDLPRGANFRANFSVDPSSEFVIDIDVQTGVPQGTASTGIKVDMERVKDIPIGGPGRDFTDVADMSPTASKDAAGIRLAGTGGDESKYQVDGANVNNPSFGTVGVSIVQEFLEEVEIQESGYDAEFGGAAGGIVSARRIGGSNKIRGEVVFRFTPRLATPRLISGTDEALRVASVVDYTAQGVFVISGPIVKDKLFFALGVVPGGNRNSLIQSFHARTDKDASGGFTDCPYKNGDFDCAPGANDIQTEKFAEQKFRTGGFQFGYFYTLDWAITPKHRLRLSGGGGPSFVRSTFRLPFSEEPNSFGTNPEVDVGGASNVGSGIVNEHFGTSLYNETNVGLQYEGRVLQDNMEIDAGINYYQSSSNDAWKLDNPGLKEIPYVQETDTQGRNLFQFLDRDKAVYLVDRVDEFCNRPELPGLSCPTRRWVSGGIGTYDKDTNRRISGNLYLTNFFNIGKTNHQLKYGTLIEHLSRRLISTYSGDNEDDFYNQCPTEQQRGGDGEYCYNPATGTYDINNSFRVNNNRAVLVDSDNPNNRSTRGYGRVRKEQGDLRAIASPLGAGIRAPFYDETTSTQNYAVFLQDKMRLLSNLYLNAGVRWELQDMQDIFGERAIFVWDNVAPRVGISYDWTNEGKSRLFASYGWFFRQLPLQLNNRVFGGLVTVGRKYRASDCEGSINTINGPKPASIDGLPTEYCTDTKDFTTGLTAGAVVPRLKGQYNEQFQVGYEQEVIEDLVLGVSWLHTSLGRAVEDVSTDGGNNFIIANPGVGVSKRDIDRQKATCEDLESQFQALPEDDPASNQLAREINRCNFLATAFSRVNELYDKPSRNFDAWTFRVQKRFAKNWILNANYTYSRLVGNYDGSVDRNTGAINIGASTQYDIPELVRNSYGPLSYDTPHVLKIDGFYSFDLREAGRLTLGTSFRLSSGTPINVNADNNRYAGSFLVHVLPRGSGGRIDPYYQWNLSAGYAYPLPKELEIEFNARVFNVTNAKATLRVDEIYSYQNARPVAGGGLDDLKYVKVQDPGQPVDFFAREILDPQGNWRVPTQFQQPIAAQFELRLRF